MKIILFFVALICATVTARTDRGSPYPVTVYTSECSATCGSGIRIQKFILCQEKLTVDNELETVCEPEVFTKEIPCPSLPPCEAAMEFGPWGEWTSCSKSCLWEFQMWNGNLDGTDTDEWGLQSRTRTCISTDQARCDDNSVETRFCGVKLCQ